MNHCELVSEYVCVCVCVCRNRVSAQERTTRLASATCPPTTRQLPANYLGHSHVSNYTHKLYTTIILLIMRVSSVPTTLNYCTSNLHPLSSSSHQYKLNKNFANKSFTFIPLYFQILL